MNYENKSDSRSGGFRPTGPRNMHMGPREMHKATCADCKQETEVPSSHQATDLYTAGNVTRTIDRRDSKVIEKDGFFFLSGTDIAILVPAKPSFYCGENVLTSSISFLITLS